MPFSNESKEFYRLRKNRLDSIKKNTLIGIFGSFYKTRKPDLLTVKNFLLQNGYNARISEDLDTLTENARKKIDCAIYDRELSERLITESDIHIFVLVRQRKSEPENLIQSVSMEIEHLHTLDRCGQKSGKYVAVYAETGLIGTMGALIEGLLRSKKGDWDIEEYDEIQEICIHTRQFCMNCILGKTEVI